MPIDKLPRLATLHKPPYGQDVVRNCSYLASVLKFWMDFGRADDVLMKQSPSDVIDGWHSEDPFKIQWDCFDIGLVRTQPAEPEQPPAEPSDPARTLMRRIETRWKKYDGLRRRHQETPFASASGLKSMGELLEKMTEQFKEYKDMVDQMPPGITKTRHLRGMTLWQGRLQQR